MRLLENHLEQISLSSAAIAELPLPPQKIFTNALLHSHDITALIRDTEVHERALFTSSSGDQPSASALRRNTVQGLDNDYNSSASRYSLLRTPRQGSAVAALVGEELDKEIRKGGNNGRDRGEVDVNVLLKGAEKLCGIYPIPGALERIFMLRERYEKLSSSITHYESRISRQTSQLARMNNSKNSDDIDGPDNINNEMDLLENESYQASPQDILLEEEEIRELEKKKRALEDRVNGMERDLGGLLR